MDDFKSYGDRRDLPSFPTRRSSDLSSSDPIRPFWRMQDRKASVAGPLALAPDRRMKPGRIYICWAQPPNPGSFAAHPPLLCVEISTIPQLSTPESLPQ